MFSLISMLLFAQITPNAAQYKAIEKSTPETLSVMQETTASNCMSTQWPSVPSSYSRAEMDCNYEGLVSHNLQCVVIYNAVLTAEEYVDYLIGKQIADPRKTRYSRPGGVWSITTKVQFSGLMSTAAQTCWEDLTLTLWTINMVDVRSMEFREKQNSMTLRIHYAETIATDDLIQLLADGDSEDVIESQ